MRRFAATAWVIVCAAACGPKIQPARTTVAQPPMPREIEAAERLDDARCNPRWGLLVPGMAQVCFGKRTEGAVLASLFVSEVTTAVAAARTVDVPPGESTGEHPAVLYAAVAAQDVWIYGYADYILDRQRAGRLRFAPQDTLGELAWAPFNPNVMRETDVWAGILGMWALGVGVSLAVDEDYATNFGARPNLFGKEFDPVTGHALGAATFGGLFTHVAIAEETLFRGVVQSGFARNNGETAGWVWGSVLFGGVHALNIFTLPDEDRTEYLTIGVPFITVIGSYMGLSYRWHDYSLAPPVAIHFWYDFLLSATFFVMDPETNPLAARVAIPF